MKVDARHTAVALVVVLLSCLGTLCAQVTDSSRLEAGEAATRELEALTAKLVSAHELKSLDFDVAADIAGREALFERRFGVKASALPGWSAVRYEAAATLRLMDSPAADHGFEARWQVARSVLLRLTDRLDEAEMALTHRFTFEDWDGDGCRYCLPDGNVDLSERRSELCERRGDIAGALHFAWAALLWYPNGGIVSQTGPDIILARLGCLLGEAGHASEGELLLRLAARAYVGQVGGLVAANELKRRGIVPEDNDLDLHWRNADSADGPCFLSHSLAIVDQRQPDGGALLAVRESADGDDCDAKIVGLGEAGFEKCLAMHETYMKESSGPWLVGEAGGRQGATSGK